MSSLAVAGSGTVWDLMGLAGSACVGAVSVGLLLGCSSVFLQEDGFQKKIDAGCHTLDECERLLAEAHARVERCQPNTIGYVRCDDARADAKVIEAQTASYRKAKLEADEAARQQQLAEERRKLEADRLAEEARLQAERAAEEERARIERDQRADETRRLREEQAEARRASEIGYYRLMSQYRRAEKLRECHATGGDCDELARLLVDAAEAEPDKRQLVELHERYRVAPPSPPAGSGGESRSSGSGSVKCCDGTLSPSCLCGGSLRGCCSHHRGVCGCE